MNKESIVLKSKELIADGFIVSMKKNTFNDITIKDIAVKSAVSTRTIYRHFKSKDDILLFTLMNMIEKYRSERDKPSEIDLQLELQKICHYFSKKRDFFRLVYRDRKFGTFRKALNDIGIVGLYLFDPSEKEVAFQNFYYSKYYKRFIVSILSDLIEEWTKNGFQETPEELATVAIHFVTSISDAATSIK